MGSFMISAGPRALQCVVLACGPLIPFAFFFCFWLGPLMGILMTAVRTLGWATLTTGQLANGLRSCTAMCLY